MKDVYIIGFLGVGIRDTRYEEEHDLIKVGHVGMAFAADEALILGFHPTPEAIESVGGRAKALNQLRKRETLEARLQDDTEIFRRANVLSQSNPRLVVWQYTIHLDAEAFTRVRSQALAWYNEKTTFSYAFPRKGAMPPETDNCATFPRKLGLPLLEASGHLYFHIPLLAQVGEKWQPKRSQDD